MLDGVVAVLRGCKDIERVAEHRPAELARLVRRRFGDLRLETLEQLYPVHSFCNQVAHRLARFVLGLDYDAGALAPEHPGAFRRRSVDDVSRSPHPRAAHAAVLHTFALRDDPLHRIVGNVRAGEHAVSEIDLTHPVAIVAVPIDQPRQNGLALGVDHLRAGRNRDFTALADLVESPIAYDD